ncbi:putative Leucine-rich repeat receptor-like protein kinase family protein [Hibiscus syriacus]|uniref:S-protein homolog n=1 Tax=Hibiscus syriacus TaxID=106335 RepID=A0A6A3A3G7_HIBSY|nr:S-protein homolog 20-like [Hibiscus syriacus]KAE8698834.1 putative Leucine-rich repeat receptor-like protein kinase family protein [Hibiscus syriacus]
MADLKLIIAFPILASISLLYPSAIAAINEDMVFINYHIHIVNDLPNDMPPGVPPLKIHCKSGDRDIGEMPMFPHDDYQFDTKVDWFATTLFFCSVDWLEGKQQSFDAFVARRDEHRCRKYHNSCLWSVREDGIYFSDDNLNWFNTYPW